MKDQIKKIRWTEAEVLALPSSEHEFFERKSGRLLDDSDFLHDLAKAISAFANSGGGHIILGVKDDGLIDSLPQIKKCDEIWGFVEMKQKSANKLGLENDATVGDA